MPPDGRARWGWRWWRNVECFHFGIPHPTDSFFIACHRSVSNPHFGSGTFAPLSLILLSFSEAILNMYLWGSPRKGELERKCKGLPRSTSKSPLFFERGSTFVFSSLFSVLFICFDVYLPKQPYPLKQTVFGAIIALVYCTNL